MVVPKSHPRYESLRKRELILDGIRDGLVAEAGAIAHGRGEAFDYMMGEKTLPSAQIASIAAAALLVQAERPVISVNGNTAVLAAPWIIQLSELLNAPLEINLFYRTDDRIRKLTQFLEDRGAKNILGAKPDREIPGIDHARALCCDEGIYSADVILVPLEDGDRAKALVDMGKKTIVVDLNPLSRSSRTATITLVDELTRAIPLLIENVKAQMDDPDLRILTDFDNLENMGAAVREMSLFLSDAL
ncbi:MAG: phosphopantothenate/pantothenate synthetase [Thermoplasmata archaeon]|nr:phosphopantothenate/pantothenate synthetase [Thermoplasmata archaeon]